jgi:hypothetical protein
MKHPTVVDRSAPVLATLDIEIGAPRDTVWRLQTDVNAWPSWQTDITEAHLDLPFAEGVSFDWSTYGMAITSTVYVLDEGSRIIWGGGGNGITAIHEWTFTEVPAGVRVATTESFAGDPVEADPAAMQGLLDQSLRSWLEHLRNVAEQ